MTLFFTTDCIRIVRMAKNKLICNNDSFYEAKHLLRALMKRQ